MTKDFRVAMREAVRDEAVLRAALAGSISGGQYLIDGGRLASPSALRSFGAN